MAAVGVMVALPAAESEAGLLITILSAVSAFFGTNLDDILLLLLFFSRLDRQLRALAVVVGQYLGIGLLVLISLGGLLGHALLPAAWMGLLGLLPISLAVSRWLAEIQPRSALAFAAGAGPELPPLRGSLVAQALAVAAVTVANGGDNVGVYLPLFAGATTAQTLLTLLVFAVMVALWCLIAWRLSRAPVLGSLLERHASRLTPPVLAGLGLVLLLQAHTFSQREPAVLALTCLVVMVLSLGRQLQRLPPALSLPAPPPAGRSTAADSSSPSSSSSP